MKNPQLIDDDNNLNAINCEPFAFNTLLVAGWYVSHCEAFFAEAIY